MPIGYKVVERAQPGVPGGGNKIYCAHAVSAEKISIKKIAREIEKFSALSEPDIRGVIIALQYVVINHLLEGRIVSLDDLGSMRVGISGNAFPTKEEVTKSAINSAHVIFHPGEDLRNTLKNAEFKKF